MFLFQVSRSKWPACHVADCSAFSGLVKLRNIQSSILCKWQSIRNNTQPYRKHSDSGSGICSTGHVQDMYVTCMFDLHLWLEGILSGPVYIYWCSSASPTNFSLKEFWVFFKVLLICTLLFEEESDSCFKYKRILRTRCEMNVLLGWTFV